jgi:hypothetical protein
MKALEITPINIYSCQWCQKEIKTSKIYKIEENFSPVCSYKCFFNVVYHILQKYNINQQIELFYILYPNICLIYEVNPTPNTQKNICFDNTKVYVKIILPKIKQEVIIIK